MIAPVYLFAGDAFYYLDIARHRVLNGLYSFDGSYTTNGFHPMWEWTLVLLGKLHLVDFTQLTQPLIPVFIADILLLSLGSGLVAMAGSRFLKQPRFAVLAVAPGLFWYLVGPVALGSFSSWAFANGMESAMALMWFGAAFVLATGPTVKTAQWPVAALLLALFVLSRLDDIFLAACGMFWILRQEQRRRKLQTATVAAFILPIALYLVYNRVTAGTLFPSSGAAKAGFAAFLNLKRMVALFLPVLTGDGPSVLIPFNVGYFGLGEVLQRMAQMLLPAAICAFALLRSWRLRRTGRPWTFLDAMAVGVLLKAAYNFAFVFLWHQGQWYYTSSIAVANVILVYLLEELLGAFRPKSGWSVSLRYTAITSYCLLYLLSFNLFISSRNLGGPSGEVRLLQDPTAFQLKLRALNANRIIEFDDGFTSYVARLPAIAGIGLALDHEATQAAHQGELMSLLWNRGYRIAVAPGSYAVAVQNANQVNTLRGHDAIFAFHANEFDRFRMVPVGNDGSDDGMDFYQIEKR